MAYSVLPAYGLEDESIKIESFGSGLINHTWKITDRDKSYILQRVNHQVFKEPGNIAFNIGLISDYLKRHYPDYTFVAPLPAANGADLIFLEGEGYFRLFPFVSGSYTIDAVETADQAYEAARQFGKFTRLLSGFDATRLKVTIPSFHDLGLRYRQLRSVLNSGNRKRLAESAEVIRQVLAHSGIAGDYTAIQSSPAFKVRVTHHDTKISNVLLDAHGKGICVIDLDTMMPGLFISDLGDMMRTYLCPVSEEERDLEKIEVREEFYQGIVQGYFDEMKDELTQEEKKYVFYSGKFMIYMQAIRFLTDHINDDVYYGARYEGHNLVRAQNQLTLLQKLIEKESLLTGKGL